MKTRIVVSMVLIMAVVTTLAAIWPASPAFADQPLFKTVQFDRTSPDGSCLPNFPMTARYAGTIHEAFHYDQAGNPTFTSQTFVHFTVTFTDLLNGNTLTTSEPGLAHYIPDFNGTGYFSGIFYLITVPGQGPVLLDVGRLIFAPDGTITFEAGPHQYYNGDVQAFCSALAGS
jgi:hypothetical protein